MSEQQSAPNFQFISCPVCQGSGLTKNGLGCPDCAGMGAGAFYHDRFYYWGLKLGRAVIELNHLRQSAHLVINVVAYTIGLIGLFSLAWWIWLAGEPATQLGAFAFWREKHVLILIFWLSLIADMFMIYRLSREEAARQKIKQLSYEEKRKPAGLPNNWRELKKFNSQLRLDVASGYSFGAMKIVEQAYLLAHRLKHERLEIMHLFFSCLRDKQVAAVFSRLNLDGSRLIEKIKNQLSGLAAGQSKVAVAAEATEALIEAYFYAYQFRRAKVEAVDLLLPCLNRDQTVKEILYDLDIDYDKIYNVITWFSVNQRLVEIYKFYKKTARFKPASTMDRAYTAVATPVLNHYGYDLTIAAKWGRLEFCIARDREIEKIFDNLLSGRNAVMLVGPPGVGKNTVADGLAQLMVQEDVPKILKDKRLVELDLARLLSGVTPAQAQERLLVITDEVIRAGNIVLYIDNIENLMGITAGDEESLDLSEVLTSALERKNFFLLASVSQQNYHKYLEGRPLGEAAAQLEIKEPSGNQAIQMIESKIGFLESKYRVYFSYNAIDQAVQLSAKYIHDKYLPDKAIKILESIAVKVAKNKGENSLVSGDDVAAMVSEITTVPITRISEQESDILLNLEEKIHEQIVDQEEAVRMVAASLRRARTQLREDKRPIASFLFLGPTGVGKTELTKAIARIYFGQEDYLIRLDMSEYQHPDSITKMIGDARGALGYLTEAVRRSPFSLILLDEFEKAHSEILNLFLQVMDDGRLTDGQGRTIDFTNCIIIATSNIGSLYIQEQIRAGAAIEAIKETLINQELNQVIRPELINRFDGIIVFKPLSRANVIAIAKLLLNNISRMLETKGMSLRADETGIKKLAQLGFDPKFGARPLRRLLQEKVEDQIANKILEGRLARRDTVVIDAEAEIKVEKGREL